MVSLSSGIFSSLSVDVCFKLARMPTFPVIKLPLLSSELYRKHTGELPYCIYQAFPSLQSRQVATQIPPNLSWPPVHQGCAMLDNVTHACEATGSSLWMQVLKLQPDLHLATRSAYRAHLTNGTQLR